MITVPLFATSASGHTVKISKTTRQASTGPSTLNNRSTVPTIKTISLYSLPLSFYFWQVFGLLLVGLLFLALSRSEQLDWLISNYWFDPVGQNFPWEHNKWLDLLNHRLLKMALIATAIAALLWGIYRRNGRLVTTALLFGLGPLVIGILKATSAHSCPWDLVEYGGKALNYVLMDTAPPGAGPGHCFPGGHASSGFAVMALFFLFYPERPRLAMLCWFAGIGLGMLMGFGQIMRGAHFLTHNLWAGWWVWLSQLAAFWMISGYYQRIKGTE
ncbi:phosphatase PAP2 family protein [Yersinia pseudotuberculosis]|uniref:Phosphatase PAP2 family protein n=2 Tax=Yersinia pseudotuberculosis TaxID=633 RepID=A0ABM7AMQ6_YERPU|nr:phosphatase PAP2 family protein [Yersinia pseudotuberculosis]CAH20596.1 putative membrane protein [Yersinia pseudotuberculosis IP 32953]AYW97949.1 phosphatase PAP2 family protein [Yersinia pseudotuberculosis]AYX14943.1 phosphatase PAP2 family protein [Yersinia pseudotuberculosis]MBO1605483.1 phosphatase PAP2 family protein [Yersinia pseudotuberculosis]